MATKINGRQIDITKAGLTGSNSTLLTDITAGITLTGSVFLLADPAENLQAATKQYVDSQTGGAIPTRSIAFGQADGSGFAGDKELVFLTGSGGTFGGALVYGLYETDPKHALDTNLPEFINAGTGSVMFSVKNIHLTSSALVGIQGNAGQFKSKTTMTVESATNTVISAGGTMTVTGSGTSTFGDDVGTLVFDGSGAASTSAVTTLDLDGSGAVTLNSSGGTISIGNDDVAQNINIGTDGARTITIGEDASTKVDVNALIIELDSAGTIEANATTTLDLDAAGVLSINSSAAAINIGNDAVNQALNLGTGGARAIRAGSASATSVGLTGIAVDLTGGTSATVTDGTASLELASGAASLSSATTVDLDGSGAMSLNSSAAAINIGNDAVAQKITVGGDTGTRTEVELNAIVVDINGGATGVTIDSLDAGSIDIGVSAVAASDTSAINIGTSATARTITIGADESTKVDVNAQAIELDSAGSIVLNSVTTYQAQATTTMSSVSGEAMSFQAVDGGINFTGGAADNVSVVLGAAAGAEAFQVNDNVGQAQFSVGSAGAISFGDGAWDYSSTSLIAEPAFYFTSSVLHSNIGPDHPAPGVAPNGIHGAFSASLGASGEFFNISPAVYLNGLRIRSGTVAQVTAGTRDYYSLKVTSGSVNYLVVSMSSVPVTGDVIMCDFRRSS